MSWIGLMALCYLLLTISFVWKPYYDFMDSVSVLAVTGVIIFFAFGPGRTCMVHHCRDLSALCSRYGHGLREYRRTRTLLVMRQHNNITCFQTLLAEVRKKYAFK
ncbi:hypothetical protein ACHAWO_001926 [Cyclotella atomus]|uniref:Uncharacterized protein n=1 Tax=Cyclotella atomus TaxID=382360 RepID=A0ABD3NLM2_9STRA